MSMPVVAPSNHLHHHRPDPTEVPSVQAHPNRIQTNRTQANPITQVHHVPTLEPLDSRTAAPVHTWIPRPFDTQTPEPVPAQTLEHLHSQNPERRHGRTLRRLRARTFEGLRTRTERGAATAEYAVTIVAACGLAGILVALLKSPVMQNALKALINYALKIAGVEGVHL